MPDWREIPSKQQANWSNNQKLDKKGMSAPKLAFENFTLIWGKNLNLKKKNKKTARLHNKMKAFVRRIGNVSHENHSKCQRTKDEGSVIGETFCSA